MLSLVEKIRSGYLWDFPGGIHPPENKRQSNQTAMQPLPLPTELVLPVKQHIGKPGDLAVNPGDRVLKGQALTKCSLSFMLPVHAPTSGVVTAIEPRTTAHPSGLTELAIVIQPDGEEEWIEKHPIADFKQETPDALIEIIRNAGISGMGGAGFPTAKKIQSGLAKTKIFIVNAAECEPYITADDRLMQEHAEEIIKGIEIVEHILKPELTIIGIEDNKPEAIEALQLAATAKDLVIRVIPTKYPSGGEKQLIKILTDKEVPANGIPADIGILVQNVGSMHAVKRAVINGEPLIQRVVTLTGKTFKQPKNVWALLGTPVSHLLEHSNYKADKKSPRLIMGGPMMGFTLPHANVPITKTANCILAPSRRELPTERYEMECIRCGECADVCPASLLPQQLQWYAKDQDYDKCEELNLKDCIECGACAFVCPSEIPLVHYYREAKAEIRTRKDEAIAAERAKRRFEEKNARMERDKLARENKFKKAAESRRKELKTSDGDDAIAAAIARVKAQKAKEPAKDEVKPAVAAAIAKAKAKQAEAMSAGKSEPDNSEMAKLREERKRQARERKAQKAAEAGNTDSETGSDDKKDAVAAAIARARAKKAGQATPDKSDKKDAVAAAIARAKAKKAQQSGTEAPEDVTSEGDSKKQAIAAAIARAKAKKAQQAQEQDQSSDTNEDGDSKKAAVAAAIARAKARKAEKEQQVQPESENVESAVEEDPKKAAVAAAIARAKARKAEKEQQAQPEPESAEPTVEEDPKKAAVAAAIARAKARKAEKEQQAQPESENVESTVEEDPKKAAVTAAIARAKARKAEKEQQAQPQSESVEPAAEEDPKKAAVAAAIARAKARKAAKEQETESEPENSEPAAEEDPKKAAVAAAIARAKARKAAKEQEAAQLIQNQSEENE
ncbi:putative Electron transport complex protein rnfC [Vibrio nigripulchritudo FTn2]|uniref:electron transport complex subunit RsxC n=1 Tax=Vibrio nigripulchritudo TaxID=28173 RepID=UPI0003B21722|nr:electron transport complex subunit RsxC [Vibrio nigripulchritudo]CCN44463.1 putative Electron transport complex protein rnfC [Vibrio nigripulchritudo FTn2]